MEPQDQPAQEAPAEQPAAATIAEEFPRLAAIAAEAEAQKRAELSRFDAETVELVNAQADVVGAAEAEHEKCKKCAADAKRQMEAEEATLRTLIRERRENRGKPRQQTLFDVLPADAPPGPPVEPAPDAPADPAEDLWQRYPLNRLDRWGVTEKDLEKLAVGKRKRGLSPVPMATVGDMARYTAGDPNNPGYQHELTDFDGIGPSIANRIVDAQVAFFAWWNQQGGKEEFAAEMGVPSGQGQGSPVEPGAVAVPGGGGEDRGGGDQHPPVLAIGPGVGDHGLEHHRAAVEFGFSGGACVTPEQLAAHVAGRPGPSALPAVEDIDIGLDGGEPDVAEPFDEPQGGPEEFTLDPDEGR